MVTVQFLNFLTLFFTWLGFGVLDAVAQFRSGGEEGEPRASSGRRRKPRPRERLVQPFCLLQFFLQPVVDLLAYVVGKVVGAVGIDGLQLVLGAEQFIHTAG